MKLLIALAIFLPGSVAAKITPSRALVFVSQDAVGIEIYDAATLHPVGVIRNPPGFLATDREGDLYFADYNNGFYFKIYSPPYTQAPVAIKFASELSGVGVDQRTGVYVVITTPTSPDGGPAKVFFFRHGETKPCAVVQAPQSMTYIYGNATFDGAGTVFFESLTQSGEGAVVSISGECTPGPIVTYAPVFAFLAAIQFNNHNQLVVQSGTVYSGGPIYTFAHPKNGQLGTPLYTTQLNNLYGEPVSIQTLSSDGKYIWASPNKPGFALYKYPQGGAPVRVGARGNVATGETVATGATFPELSP